MKELKINEKINIREILNDIENYRPRRRGWTWRDAKPTQYGPFLYNDASAPLKNDETNIWVNF